MRRNGYTLVETLMVLSLAGFMIYGGAVSFNRLVPKYRLQTGVWEVESALAQARFKAAWQGRAYRVRFEGPVCFLEARDEASGAWRPGRSVRLEGVEVRANNSPTFHPEGTVSDLATISLANARGAYKITVAISGRVKVTKTA